jgi:hypothetical protein
VLAIEPRPVTEIETEARGAGFLKESERINQNKPVRSAKKRLGIETYKPPGSLVGGWVWRLPKAPSCPEGAL